MSEKENSHEQGRRLARLIIRMGGTLQEVGEILLKDTSLTVARSRVLGLLVREKAPLTIPQIGKKLGQSRQGLNRLVAIMVGDGLLDYQTNPDHSRSKLVIPTMNGVQAYIEANAHQDDFVAQLTEPLSQLEIEQLLSLLRKLEEHVRIKKADAALLAKISLSSESS